MQKSTMMILVAVLAISVGCGDSATSSEQSGAPDSGRRTAFGPEPGPSGACTLTCEGKFYACERTSQDGCRSDAFAQVPRCLYDLAWSAGEACGADAGGESVQPVLCDEPKTQCTGYSLTGHVDYTMDPCTPVLCAQRSDEEAQAQSQYAQACEEAGGEATQCDCGLTACSVDPATLCNEPKTQCTGYILGGRRVDYTMDPCAPVPCDVSEADAQAQQKYARSCKAAGGEVTQCECGLSACSVDPASENPGGHCDDGSIPSVYCDTAPPCTKGTIRVKQKGCSVCIESKTCKPPSAEPS